MVLGKLRIPHIIGMIFAGIIIGEHGFNILERDSSFELFGKVGLYYIMFLAGLEMDLDDFKKNSSKGIVFGLLTFIIPMVLGIWSSMEMLGFGVATICPAGEHVRIPYPCSLPHHKQIRAFKTQKRKYYGGRYCYYGGACADSACRNKRHVQG